MHTYYFTFGIDGQPYDGGWVEIVASNRDNAFKIFREHFPDKRKGVLNCAGFYTEEEFVTTSMHAFGNFGNRCRERFFEDGAVSELFVPTKAGTLVVRENTDPGAPGFSIAIRKNDGQELLELAYIEVKENEAYFVDDETSEDVCVYVYEKPECDDYTKKMVISGREIGNVLS